MILLEGTIKVDIVIQYHCSCHCSGGITVTFLGKDLDVVPTTLVIDIIDNIDNLDNTTTSMLVEQYNIVSILNFRDC